MKTFRQFMDLCEQSQRSLRSILGPGVPSERSTRTTSISSLRDRASGDWIEPRRSGGGTAPLSQSTYQGRVEAGRRPGIADNPDYIGPMGFGGQGTRDTRMPGTTPSLKPSLPPPGSKKITSPTGPKTKVGSNYI